MPLLAPNRQNISFWVYFSRTWSGRDTPHVSLVKLTQLIRMCPSVLQAAVTLSKLLKQRSLISTQTQHSRMFPTTIMSSHKANHPLLEWLPLLIFTNLESISHPQENHRATIPVRPDFVSTPLIFGFPPFSQFRMISRKEGEMRTEDRLKRKRRWRSQEEGVTVKQNGRKQIEKLMWEIIKVNEEIGRR